ncbi:MAG: discoidin domain-containing protein, partial [Chloroflexia bacterium]|nr:discoidin domain-containing protein [Chloroflexia bacterium]
MLLAAVVSILAIGFWVAVPLIPVPSAVAMMQDRNAFGINAGTPVAGDIGPGAADGREPANHDPLDGDPLDGPAPAVDPNAPAGRAPLDIERSGRPKDEPSTLAAYDADSATIWTPGTDATETWLWLDLGEEQPIGDVHWLAQGAGTVAVSISDDLRRWREVDRVTTGGIWDGVSVGDDARYVRLGLSRDDGGPPAIAEVAVYGAGQESISAQQGSGGKERARQRQRDGRGTSASRQQAVSNNASRRESGNQADRARANG